MTFRYQSSDEFIVNFGVGEVKQKIKILLIAKHVEKIILIDLEMVKSAGKIHIKVVYHSGLTENYPSKILLNQNPCRLKNLFLRWKQLFILDKIRFIILH